MIYDVRHRTSFEYEESVSVSQHVLHLMPRFTTTQTRLSFDLDVRPEPALMTLSEDYFGNLAHYMSIQEPHRQLIVESRCRVEIFDSSSQAIGGGQPWEQVTCTGGSVATVPIDVLQFAYHSPYSIANAAVHAFAMQSFAAGRPVVDATMDLTSRIHKEFQYEGGVSDVSTPVSEVLDMRKGVCQDFAHLELACLRSLGVPARYVSGYLLTRPPASGKKLIGADASHAWISVWCGDAGWIDFDPTNNLMPDIEHITVAWGRDYGDVSPINGFIVGSGGHKISVAVDVAPLTVAA